MANKIINDLTSASALTGSEVMEVEQAGASKKTTPADLKTYMAIPAKIAWCTFDGTSTGTNAPTLGQNVTSVTRNGTGDYTINFTNAFSNSNYCVSGIARRDPGMSDNGNIHVAIGGAAPTTTALRILTPRSDAAGVEDPKIVCVQVFGT